MLLIYPARRRDPRRHRCVAARSPRSDQGARQIAFNPLERYRETPSWSCRREHTKALGYVRPSLPAPATTLQPRQCDRRRVFALQGRRQPGERGRHRADCTASANAHAPCWRSWRLPDIRRVQCVFVGTIDRCGIFEQLTKPDDLRSASIAIPTSPPEQYPDVLDSAAIAIVDHRTVDRAQQRLALVFLGTGAAATWIGRARGTRHHGA